jgi:endonuclease/exonuclease/phosphatase (EEP) superfamily protein YafD
VKRDLWLRRLAYVSLGVIVALYLITCQLGDRVWWALPFLYGPRWLLSLPLLGVVPWLVVSPRRGIAPASIAAALVFFGLLDVHVGLGRFTVGAGIPFRVLELNAGGGSGDRPQIGRILAEFRRQSPDLIVVAECSGSEMHEAFRVLPGYEFRVSMTSLCLLSRGKVLEWDERDPADFWKEGGAGAIVRAVVASPGGPLRVGLVHLETPRDALDNYPDLSSIPTLGNITRANIKQREKESRAARAWILTGPDSPTVIAGDFNLPVESAIFREYWGQFRDAFGRAGVGQGHTKETRWWGSRIDHVLTSSDIGARQSLIGRDVGSDHLPVIADLVLPAP